MFGKEKYAKINRLLNRELDRKKTLVAVHRGAWGGNVVENTILSYRLAREMGADMFECDVSMSTDGVLYVFHDGNEKRLFGIDENITTLSSKEIDDLVYLNSISWPSCFGVERFDDVIAGFQGGELYNVDRAWNVLPQTLDVMRQYPWSLEQALVKSPVSGQVLDYLRECPQKYMYMPIVYTMEEVETVLSQNDINLVGMEIIAQTPQDAMYQDENIRYIKDRGLFVWVNAITLTGLSRSMLFGGLDDDTALRTDRDAGWGRLFDKRIDIIQTDWPYQLSVYRDECYGLGR